MSNDLNPEDPRQPIFQEIRGVEYTTVRTSVYRLSLYVCFFFGVLIGVILACGVVFYA